MSQIRERLGYVTLASVAVNLWFVFSISDIIVLLGPPKWLEMLLSLPMVLAFYCLLVVVVHSVRDIAARRTKSADPEENREDRRLISFQMSFVGLGGFIAVAVVAVAAASFMGRARAVGEGTLFLFAKIDGALVLLLVGFLGAVLLAVTETEAGRGR